MSKPIRRTRTQKTTRSAWDGRIRPVEEEETTHTLSTEGAPDSEIVTRQEACDCGCLKAPAGYCSVCNGVSCESCFGHCRSCRRPICPAHSFFVQARDGVEVRLCASCHEEAGGDSVLSRVSRTILGAFFESGD